MTDDVVLRTRSDATRRGTCDETAHGLLSLVIILLVQSTLPAQSIDKDEFLKRLKARDVKFDNCAFRFDYTTSRRVVPLSILDEEREHFAYVFGCGFGRSMTKIESVEFVDAVEGGMRVHGNLKHIGEQTRVTCDVVFDKNLIARTAEINIYYPKGIPRRITVSTSGTTKQKGVPGLAKKGRFHKFYVEARPVDLRKPVSAGSRQQIRTIKKFDAELAAVESDLTVERFDALATIIRPRDAVVLGEPVCD